MPSGIIGGQANQREVASQIRAKERGKVKQVKAKEDQMRLVLRIHL